MVSLFAPQPKTAVFAALSVPTFPADARGRPALKVDLEKGAHALRLSSATAACKKPSLHAMTVKGSLTSTWTLRPNHAGLPGVRNLDPNSSTGEVRPFCDRPHASMRHFCECPTFEPTRFEMKQQFAIPVGWFQAQPRVTEKSGWITFAAAPCRAKRAKLRAAACELGLEVLQKSSAFHLVCGSGFDLDALLREA